MVTVRVDIYVVALGIPASESAAYLLSHALQHMKQILAGLAKLQQVRILLM